MAASPVRCSAVQARRGGQLLAVGGAAQGQGEQAAFRQRGAVDLARIIRFSVTIVTQRTRLVPTEAKIAIVVEGQRRGRLGIAQVGWQPFGFSVYFLGETLVK
ncbi:MAG: hypothetical protein ACOYZ7_04080 [Chloroflexota bacterium]